MRITSISLLTSRRRARKQKKRPVERRMFLQSLVLVLVIEYTQPDPAKYTDRWPTEITKVSAKHFKADSFSRPGDARALNGNKENWSADRET